MITFQTSVRVERPIEEVFALISNPLMFPLWNSAVQTVHGKSGESGGPGSTYSMRRQLPTGQVENELEVLSREHPTNFGIRTTSGPTPFLYNYQFTADDANMGAIGTENSKACMLFILRMLHAQLQRQVHLPESERPRVPLLVDEAHYIAGGENVVDQIATHRAAGLEPAFGLQYFAQLGSASEHQQKILKGVLNLLQSRFLFRMGDAQDAEQATRIAMAVYSTMIRDDPDSRARLRVTPEQALNFPNYYCLASWIAHGTRAPSFMGQTYPLPDVGEEWAGQHLAAQDERVGPYPEQLESTLATNAAPTSDEPAGPNGTATEIAPAVEALGRSKRPTDSSKDPKPATSDPVKHEVQVNYEAPPARDTDLTDSPVRRIVGRRIKGPTAPEADRPGADTLRDLAFLDRINEIGPADQCDGATRLPRLYDEDYTILALLDRVGFAPVTLIARVALPGRAPRTVFDRLVKLYRHGLIARHTTGLHGHSSNDGKPPLLHSLTRRGLEVAQQREPTPAISARREWKPIEQPHAARLAHDLHALGWAIEFHRAATELATDRWRTPRYATGRYPVPQVGRGQSRHPITLNEIPVPDGQAIIDLELKTFTEIKPDLSLELRVESLKLTFDLLVELDLTARPSYNREKFLAYDAFLCGWSLAHPRYRAQGTRPAVVFVSPSNHAALACAHVADELMTGRIGVMGGRAKPLVLRRSRPRVLRGRGRHPPPGSRGARAAGAPARAPRTADRKPGLRARASKAAQRPELGRLVGLLGQRTRRAPACATEVS